MKVKKSAIVITSLIFGMSCILYLVITNSIEYLKYLYHCLSLHFVLANDNTLDLIKNILIGTGSSSIVMLIIYIKEYNEAKKLTINRIVEIVANFCHCFDCIPYFEIGNINIDDFIAKTKEIIESEKNLNNNIDKVGKFYLLLEKALFYYKKIYDFDIQELKSLVNDVTYFQKYNKNISNLINDKLKFVEININVKLDNPIAIAKMIFEYISSIKYSIVKYLNTTGFDFEIPCENNGLRFFIELQYFFTKKVATKYEKEHNTQRAVTIPTYYLSNLLNALSVSLYNEFEFVNANSCTKINYIYKNNSLYKPNFESNDMFEQINLLHRVRKTIN